MGNRDSIQQQIQIYEPKINDFKIYEGINGFTIWKNNLKKIEMMSAKVSLFSQKQLLTIIDHFKLRYQHHFLVSTLYIKCQDNSSCGGWFQTTIFYQRVFTNLSRIKDIPFLDSLHFYAVAFRGFQILFRMFGYFQIYEDMFHICQDGKLKVWCNKDISKNQPQNYLKDQYGTEFDMIRKIIFIIDENTDQSNAPFIMKDKLISYGSRNFEMVNQSLRQICRKNCMNVPQRLQCLSVLPVNQVQTILDLYSAHKNNENNSQSIINMLNHSAQIVKNSQKNQFANNFIRRTSQSQENKRQSNFNFNQPFNRNFNQQSIKNMDFTFQKQKQIRNSQSTPHFQFQQFQKPHYVNQAYISAKTNSINNPNRPHFSFKHYNNNNNNYKINNDVSQLIIQPRPQSAKQKYYSNTHNNASPYSPINQNQYNGSINRISPSIQIPVVSSQINKNSSNNLKKSSIIVNKTGLNLNLNNTGQRLFHENNNYQSKNIRYVSLPSKNMSIIEQNKQQNIQYLKKSNFNNINSQLNHKAHNLVVKFNTKSPHSNFNQYHTVDTQTNLDRYRNHKISNENLVKSNVKLKQFNKFQSKEELNHNNYYQQSNLQTFDSKKYNNINQQQTIKLKNKRPSTQSKSSQKLPIQIKQNKNQLLFLRTSNLNYNSSSKLQQSKEQKKYQKNILSKTQAVHLNEIKNQQNNDFKNNINGQTFQSPASRTNVQLNANSYFESNSINNSKITQINKKYSQKQMINNDKKKGKFIQKFDPNLNVLQSFASSKFGTQNSLKSGENQSRVLQVIGRERKDSETSAFRKDSIDVDIIKEESAGEGDINNSKSSQSGYYHISSSQNLYTDPKILQILRKAKNNKNQSTLKKGFKNHNFYVMSPKIESNKPFDNLKDIEQKFICDLPSITNMSDHNISSSSFNNYNYGQDRKQFDSQLINKSRFYHQDQLHSNQKSKQLNNIKAKQTPQRDNAKSGVNGQISQFYHYDLDKNETNKVNNLKDYLKVGYQYSKVTTKTYQNSRSNMNLNSIQELASLQKQLSNGFAKKQQISKIREQTIKNKDQKPRKKYYNPEIDESIFADLVRLRNNKK